MIYTDANILTRGRGQITQSKGPNLSNHGQYSAWGQKTQCQLCHKLGHTVHKCFYRFDKTFAGPETFQGFTGNANLAECSHLYASPDVVQDSSWYPDSGATHHLTPNPQNLIYSTDYAGDQQIHMGDGSGLNIHNIGKSFLVSPFHSQQLVLNNLLHVPNITKNLLSVSQFAKDNSVYFEFHPSYCCVKDQVNQRTLLVGRLDQGLYKFDSFQLQNIVTNKTCTDLPSVSPLDYTIPDQCNSTPVPAINSQFSLWHNRLGHPTAKIVQNALSSCNIKISNKTDVNFSDLCAACCLGKHHKFPFPNSTTEYTKPLQLLHSDLWGPAPIISSSGYKYYISYIDAYSRHTWIYMLRTKCEASPTFLTFKTQVE